MLERQYDRLVTRLAFEMLDIVRADIIPQLAELRSVFRREFGNSRFDDFGDDLRRLLDRFKARWTEAVSRRREEIEEIGIDVNAWGRRQTAKILERSLGSQLLASEADLDRQVKLWIADNVSKIQAIGDLEATRIQDLIVDSLRQDRPVEAIAEGLRDLWRNQTDRRQSWVRGVSPTVRARLVAIDQIGKLHSQLTKYRQESMGVRFYRWRTMLDNKVRHSHKALEGQVFAWRPEDGPQPPEGHPGMPPNCRCSAEPILSDAIPDVEE
jgi:SPP1 gp7 family putative phage head morphogenesis protein